LIAARFPDAAIVGVDNAAEMIEAAQKRLPGVRFELCGIHEWSEPGPWDLLYTNATLHWVGDREGLLPKLARRLSPGGSLAVMMADDVDEPTHAAARTVAQNFDKLLKGLRPKAFFKMVRPATQKPFSKLLSRVAHTPNLLA
jgi:trans-aconitate 2-methyltransferase